MFYRLRLKNWANSDFLKIFIFIECNLCFFDSDSYFIIFSRLRGLSQCKLSRFGGAQTKYIFILRFSSDCQESLAQAPLTALINRLSRCRHSEGCFTTSLPFAITCQPSLCHAPRVLDQTNLPADAQFIKLKRHLRISTARKKINLTWSAGP